MVEITDGLLSGLGRSVILRIAMTAEVDSLGQLRSSHDSCSEGSDACSVRWNHLLDESGLVGVGDLVIRSPRSDALTEGFSPEDEAADRGPPVRRW